MKRILITLSKKWPEYLLEILVITIGIYGAFALDNWNEERKQEVYKQKIIEQFIDEYEANIKQLDEKIELRKLLIKDALTTLKFIDDPSNVAYDTLITALSNIANDPTFDPIGNDLLNNGNLRLVDNVALKKNLSSWQADLAALHELERGWQKVLQEQLDPYFIELGVTRDITVQLFDNDDFFNFWLLDANSRRAFTFDKSKKRKAVVEILEEKKLEGLVSIAISYNQLSNFQSVALRKKMIETLKQLQNELNE